MSILDVVFRRRRWRHSLAPLEDRVVQAVGQRLTPEAGALLNKQLSRINLVQRHAADREVCCYPMVGGRPRYDADIAFPATDEFRLATVLFEVGGAGQFRAEVYVVKGFFFSIEFSASPRRIQQHADDVSIQQVSIDRDPMVVAETVTGEQPIGVPKWLGGVAGVVSTALPLTIPESRGNRLAEIDARLPEDYLEAVEKNDGMRIGDVTVLGIGSVRTVLLGEATYYALAEIDDVGVLAVRRGTQDGVVYQLPHDGAEPQRVASFREVILSRVARK